jgi:signal transduction histidine kinase
MRIRPTLAPLPFVFCLLVTVLPGVAAGNDSWHVTSWTTDDALPQGSVYAIHETADGYLWFTTFGGLVRYDGIEFTVFAKATTPGLRSNRFTALFESVDGTLWAGTEDGFVTRCRSGAFTTYSVDGTVTPVLSISADDSSPPWAFTEHGLFRFDGTRFVRAGPPAITRRFLYMTGSAAVDDAGVTVLHPGRPARLLPFEGLLAANAKGTVRADGKSLWIVDADKGIFRFDHDALSRIDNPVALDVIRNATAPVAGADFIGAFTQSRDGAFWIAQASRGIARVDGHSVEWITPEDGLCGLVVMRLYEDREGTMWATTRGSGISVIRRRRARTFGAAAGMDPPNAYPILSYDGQLLVGSWGGGVYRFDGQHFHRSLPSTGWVTSLADGGDGTVWVSTRNGGVQRVRGDEMRSFGTADGLPSSFIPVIYRAGNGQLWFGTSNGLATLAPGDRFVSYRMSSAGWNFIRSIAEEHDGALLLGTQAGVARFRDGRFSIVADERSLSSASIRAIHVDVDGTTWIGTYDGGLNRLREGQVATITTRQGLFDNGVFAIVEDGAFFWMSSNRGVYRVSRYDLNAVADGRITAVSSLALTRSDGLLSAECNGGTQPVAARTPDGKLWFPTQEGIVSIDPRLVPESLPAPQIIMSGVAIDGEPRSPSEELRVPPSGKRVEFRFVAPTMFESRLIRYRYKLEGFDRGWNDNGGARVVAYTNIPPGRYRFVVSASNGAGRWSQPAATELRVLPPFWRTNWFMIAAVAAASLLLGTAYRMRVAAIERKQALQVEFSRRLLTEQEGERKRVASELHDSLGQNLLIIRNRALLALDQDSPSIAKEQLEEISSTASSAIDEVRRIAHNLRPVELDHLGLTRSLGVLLRKMSSSSNILFSGDLEPVDGLLTKEAEVNIFRIVQEWLSNVARHSDANAAVVSLRREDHTLRLRIRDDGSGFSRAQAAKDERLGIGLRSIAERAHMLGGTYDIQSTLGEGTSMTIEFPVRESEA